jgi:hypothetical protein
MNDRRRPVEQEPFVCLECARRFSHMFDLRHHWETERHGPASVQKAALERFRVGGNPTDDRFTDRR